MTHQVINQPHAFPRPSHPTFPSASAITGGKPVDARNPLAETTVGLSFFDQGQRGWCTGTIVADDLILTAAHCLDGSLPDIFFGTVMDPRQAVRITPTDLALIPSDYKADTLVNDRFDIAVLRFQGGLPPGFRVAEFVPEGKRPRSLSKIKILGYGASEIHPGSIEDLGVLRGSSVRMKGRGSKTELDAWQSTFGGICPGDSGGGAYAVVDGKTVVFGVSTLVMTPKAFWRVSSRVASFVRPFVQGPLTRCLPRARFVDLGSKPIRQWIHAVMKAAPKFQCRADECSKAVRVRLK